MKNINYTNIRSVGITILSMIFLLSISTLSFSQGTRKRTYDLKSYSAVSAGGAFKINYIPSDAYTVVIIADSDQLSKVKVKVLGNTLHLNTKGVVNIQTLEAYISTPFIDEIDLSGACEFKIKEGETLKAKSLVMDISGAVAVSGDIDVDYLETEASGATKVALTGFADKHNCELSGASVFRGKNLVTIYTDIEASGASSASVIYKEDIIVDESGAAKIRSKKVR